MEDLCAPSRWGPTHLQNTFSPCAWSSSFNVNFLQGNVLLARVFFPASSLVLAEVVYWLNLPIYSPGMTLIDSNTHVHAA